jgi:nitrogen fixation negative regulator NifL
MAFKKVSIRKKLQLIVAMLAVFLLIEISHYFQDQTLMDLSHEANHLRGLQNQINSTMSREARVLVDNKDISGLAQEYRSYNVSCSACHSEENSHIPKRITTLSALQQQLSENRAVHVNIQQLLHKLTTSVRYIHEHHLTIMKNNASTNSTEKPGFVSFSLTRKHPSLAAPKPYIIAEALAIQQALFGMYDRFYRLSATKDLKKLSIDFKKEMERFLTSINSFEAFSLDAQDGLLVEELYTSVDLFENFFHALVTAKENERQLYKELSENEISLGKIFVVHNRAITEEQKHSYMIMGFLSKASMALVMILFIFVFISIRSITRGISQTISLTEKIMNDFSYRIPDNSSFFQEQHLIANALNTMAQTINKRVQKLNSEIRAHLATETELRKLTRAVEQSHSTIVITDLIGNIEYVNPAFTTNTGYSKEEALGQNPRILKSDLHGDTFYKEMWDTLLTGEVWQGEILNKRKDGTTYWEFATISQVKDEAGKATHYVAVKENISARKKAEVELREQHNRLITFIEALPDAVFIKDGQGRWLQTNQVARELFQIEDFSWQGKTDGELGLAREKFRKFHNSCILSDEAAWTQKEILSIDHEEMPGVDGQPHTFEVRKIPIFDQDGERNVLLIIGRDITKRRTAEKEKETLTKQLQLAKRMESIGLLAGGVAHDLNNILAGIVGYPELLLKKLPEDSALKKPLEAIQQSGQRAAFIVADLLTVARGAVNTREPHDLIVLIQEYFDSPECNRLKALHPEVSYQHQLTAAHSSILCSPVHIKKCLMNLTTNAAEAIDAMGTVVVSTHNLSIDDAESVVLDMAAGEYIVLSVKDSGSGIAEEDLEHIFEPFYTKKVMGRSGTGLGLTIIWNTMKDHDGKVFVESSAEGTSFHLYFPVTNEKKVSQAHIAATNEFSGNGEHILVVDDEPQLRDIASQMLLSLGYRVDSVCSGELALKFVKENPVDLLVIDMLMEPGMNGRQTYEEIIKLYPGQKAIIASGFSESDDVKATLRLGAGGFIKKPYSMEAFGRTVKETLT